MFLTAFRRPVIAQIWLKLYLLTTFNYEPPWSVFLRDHEPGTVYGEIKGQKHILNFLLFKIKLSTWFLACEQALRKMKKKEKIKEGRKYFACNIGRTDLKF